MNFSKYSQTNVLTPIKTKDDGQSGYIVVLKDVEKQKYIAIGINELVNNALAMLVNGSSLEEESVYLKMNKILKQKELEAGEKIAGIMIDYINENEGNVWLLSEKGKKQRIPFGSALVLATINGWTIYITSTSLKALKCEDLRNVSALLAGKKNPMSAVNTSLDNLPELFANCGIWKQKTLISVLYLGKLQKMNFKKRAR